MSTKSSSIKISDYKHGFDSISFGEIFIFIISIVLCSLYKISRMLVGYWNFKYHYYGHKIIKRSIQSLI